MGTDLGAVCFIAGRHAPGPATTSLPESATIAPIPILAIPLLSLQVALGIRFWPSILLALQGFACGIAPTIRIAARG